MLRLVLLVALFATAPVPAMAQEAWDLLITGGWVVDGTGAPGYRADVAIRGDRIARVATEGLAGSSATRVLDAAGLVVAPGFIDLHAHLDPLLSLPEAESHLRQGITTGLGGPDGGSPWPIGSYLDSARAARLGINVAFLVGHNTIRRLVMESANRAPTAEELERMRAMVAQSMGEGAFGLSTGLAYVPGVYSNTDEVVELARAAADSGGIYTSHLRDEGLKLFEGVAEALEIGRRAGIPVVITHHKAVGRPMWGQSVRTLAMVDSARAAGTDVMLDQYPYTATSTGIGILVPAWALADGERALRRRLRSPALRDSIVRGIVFALVNERGGGDLRFVQFSRVPWQRSLEGRTLADWALERRLPLTPQTGAALVLEALRRGGAQAIYHTLAEEDVERIMRHPLTMIATDGRLTRPGDGRPHPRAYGTFPRVLGRYVRERGVLTLETAIRKMTGMPAERLGLSDRGRVAEGWFADLVLFDPATIADRATFEDPHQYPAGIRYVLVNGVVAVEDGAQTAARAGRVIRRR
jgi:dihydroorotase/N-acyl-D-amino-acid deacylase